MGSGATHATNGTSDKLAAILPQDIKNILDV
jgi:hypothetical protein